MLGPKEGAGSSSTPCGNPVARDQCGFSAAAAWPLAYAFASGPVWPDGGYEEVVNDLRRCTCDDVAAWDGLELDRKPSQH
eukprot:10028717-Prorocentrum_lima.AAC.1